jgi:hypothetical protein
VATSVWALAAVVLAGAAAQPVSPAAGASTDSHPTFTWTLPPNEDAQSLYIARRPRVTPTGEFYRENIVARGFLGDRRPQMQWTPASALFSGAHWWNVRTHDRTARAFVFSPPMPFTVSPTTRIRRVVVTRRSYHTMPDELDVAVRWATNVQNVIVEARILRRGRVVGHVRRSEETLLSLDPRGASLTWRRPRRLRTGTRLTVFVSVRGGGKAAAVRRVVRAP